MHTRMSVSSVAAVVLVGGWMLSTANPLRAQTVVHVRTADLKPADSANLKIQPVGWHGTGYYHSYYRPPYGAYYRAPYYRPYYRPYYYGAYRAWYGNPYYFYPRYYGSYFYPYYYGPAYSGPAYYSPYALGYGYPAVTVVTPYGGFYW